MSTLDYFFCPQTVAVVGASPGKASFSNLILANLAAHRFAGGLTVVNPHHKEVDGVPAVASLEAMPARPDHCIIGVRAELVAEVLRECVRLGVPAVTIIASGFAEIGTPEGRAMQQELRDIVSGTATRVLGPNCIGLGSFSTTAVTIASGNIPPQVPKGSVAIVSQSGGVALVFLLRGVAQGMGIAHFVSVGNELDVSVPDFLEAMATRDDTRVVICYLEGARNAQALRRGVEACGRAGKPVILLRGGLTTQGKAAAASHTGALAGDGAVWRGFVKQVGAVEAQSIDHAIATARIFARFGLAQGRRQVGGFAGGGGMTVLFTDMLARAGISVPVFGAQTQSRIRAALPDVTPNNPMDMGGMFLSGDGSNLADALTAISQDPAIDLLALCMPPYLEMRDRVVNGAVVRATENLSKPAMVISYGVPGAPSALKDAGRFMLEPPEPGLLGLASWLAYRPFTGTGLAAGLPNSEHSQRLVKALTAADSIILEDEGKRLLRLYGINCPPEEVVVDEDAAVQAAGRIGYPVALKILSAGMLHRGIGRGVVIGLRDEAAVRDAFRALAVHARPLPDARWLVQAMVEPGAELLIGAARDPEMGLAMAIGLGGSHVEAQSDVLFCLPPVSPDEIGRLLDGWPALAGIESRDGPLDRQALVDVVAGVSAMLVDGGDLIDELDINPLIVGAQGKGAVAVDALFILRADGSGPRCRSSV